MTHGSDANLARRAGFTMVEAGMAMLIVSTMIVVSLNAVGGARTTMRNVSDRAKAMVLAEDMMNEVLAKYYYDPVVGGATLGPGGGETRPTYNDVDDYHNQTWTPPRYANGTNIPGYDAAWSVTVTTNWVDPYALNTTRSSETGVKRITVTVKRGNVVLATLHSLRALGWPGADGSQYLP